jgi:hypothetical protein
MTRASVSILELERTHARDAHSRHLTRISILEHKQTCAQSRGITRKVYSTVSILKHERTRVRQFVGRIRHNTTTVSILKHKQTRARHLKARDAKHSLFFEFQSSSTGEPMPDKLEGVVLLACESFNPRARANPCPI